MSDNRGWRGRSLTLVFDFSESVLRSVFESNPKWAVLWALLNIPLYNSQKKEKEEEERWRKKRVRITVVSGVTRPPLFLATFRTFHLSIFLFFLSFFLFLSVFLCVVFSFGRIKRWTSERRESRENKKENKYLPSFFLVSNKQENFSSALSSNEIYCLTTILTRTEEEGAIKKTGEVWNSIHSQENGSERHGFIPKM